MNCLLHHRMPWVALLVICAALTNAATARAESDSVRQAYYRISLQEGPNTLGMMYDEVGFGIRVSYAVQHDTRIYTGVLGAQMTDFAIFSDPHAVLVELGGMVGNAHTERWWHFSYSAGASLMFAQRRGNPVPSSGWFGQKYEAINSYGVGLLGEAQLLVTPLSFLGIGATVHASVNTFRPYLAGLITLQFGQLR